MIDAIIALIMIAIGGFLIFMGGAIALELVALAYTMVLLEVIGWAFCAVLSVLAGLLCFALLTEL